MQISIPSQDTKSFSKPSRGELFGNVWATHNIDFGANKGKIRLSERTFRVFDSGDDSDFEIPVKFIRSNADQTERWFALVQNAKSSVSDGLLFKTSGIDPLTDWAQDAIANSPTDCVDDMEIFGQANSYDRLVVSRDTDLAMLNNGTWTASWWDTTLAQNALVATNPHPLEQFTNLLIVCDGNVVHTIDDSLVVVANRIVLPKEYQIVWTANDGSRVFFGTRHKRNGEALVFPWNGTDKTYEDPIPVGSYISLAGFVPPDGVLRIVNGRGQLMIYNGNAFNVLASLPVVEKKLKWSNQTSRMEMVHPNGMALIDNEISILLSASTDEDFPGSTFFEEFMGGIWAYNEDVGLYRKYSIGQYDGSTDNDWGSAQISLTGALIETDLKSGRFLAGCGIYSDYETIIRAMITSKVDQSVTNKGYFITPQIQSSSVRNFWKRLNLSFKKLENSTDRIIIKYRTDVYPLKRDDGRMYFYRIDVVDTDTFTITDASSNFHNIAAIGDELEIIVGKGAGSLVHITSISGTGPTYTVNIDESIPNISGISACVVNRWKKLGTISSQTVQKELFKIANRSKWIQLKIELRGTESSPEIEELLLDYNQSNR